MEFEKHGLQIIVPKRPQFSRSPSPHYPHITHPSPYDSMSTLVQSLPSECISEWEPSTPETVRSLPRKFPAVLVIESTVLVLALTTLGLASAYGVQLVQAPRQADRLPVEFIWPGNTTLNNSSLNSHAGIGSQTTAVYSRRHIENWPAWTAWVIMYNGTMPLFSAIFALIGIGLAFGRKVTPIYSTIISAAFLAGWCVNLGWWITCDTVPNGSKMANCTFSTPIFNSSESTNS
jgi:hypothetical protein